MNLEAMAVRDSEHAQRAKYVHAARIFLDRPNLEEEAALDALLVTLRSMTQTLELPRLSVLGVEWNDFDRIVAHSRGQACRPIRSDLKMPKSEPFWSGVTDADRPIQVPDLET